MPQSKYSSLTMRQAAAADLPVIMALERAGFVPGIVEEEVVFAHRLATFPEGVLIAKADGQPCGYFCAEIWQNWAPAETARFDLGHDVTAWLEREGNTIYIASMTLSPEVRGGGMGRMLLQVALQHMVERFPALNEAVLIVNEHWYAARRIYLGEGFTEIDRLPAFFQPVDGLFGDALLMTRPL